MQVVYPAPAFAKVSFCPQRAASANREWERCRLERASLLAVQAEESVRVARASARERHQRAASNKTRIRRRRQQRALQVVWKHARSMLEAT